MKTEQEILETELYAWIGEDEHGSGEIGLKQAVVPAGCIPLVAVKREKIDRAYLREAMLNQARTGGKKIRLVRYQAVQIVMETEAGE